MSTRDYLTRLASLAAGTRFDDLPLTTVAAARAVTLDTLGAICAGSRLTENARLADLAAERSGTKTATLVGRARQAEPMLAALANSRVRPRLRRRGCALSGRGRDRRSCRDSIRRVRRRTRRKGRI